MIPEAYKVDFSGMRKDLVQQSAKRLLNQYQNSPVINQILAAYAQPFQELHEALIDLMEQRTLYNAKGVYADTIGLIVGRSRQIAFADGSNLIASEDFYQTLLVSQTLKNSTKFSSVLEISHYFNQAFGYNVGVELVGPMIVNLYVPAWASDEVESYIRPLANSIVVENAFVSPFPATLTINKLIQFEVLSDINNSGKNCLIQSYYAGTDDNGEDIWYLQPTTTTLFSTAPILFVDSNGSNKLCEMQARFDGVDVEGNDVWSFVVKTTYSNSKALNRKFTATNVDKKCVVKTKIIGVDDHNKDIWAFDLTTA